MSSTEETTEVTSGDVQTTSTQPSETMAKNNNGGGTVPSSEETPASPQAVAIKNQHGYYTYQQQNHTNIGNSPSASQGNGSYDIQSLLAAQQVSASSPFGHQYNLVPPLSPAAAVRDNNNNGESALPPASPLFPGTAVPLYTNSSDQLDSNVVNAPSMFASTASPTFQYLSGPPPSPVVSYGYPPSIPNSPDHRNSWTERSLQQQQAHLYNTAPAPSPHLHGLPVQYQNNAAATSRRTTSFDGEMLPPAAIVDDSSTAMFTTGGTLVSQQSWAPPPHEVYPNSSLQHLSQQVTSPPRTNGHHPHHLVREQQQQHHLPEYHGGVSPYYPVAATPGPPIQTTHNNKGPDGANLFIFHIPNHFTNLDMWHLFCHYGNLLSVRIMVEKDTGRSRGFGFVSYDSPDAAAMAIKELNGFTIGNKRLKVQHKQIRQSDNNPGQSEGSAGPNIIRDKSFEKNNTSPNNTSNAHWQQGGGGVGNSGDPTTETHPKDLENAGTQQQPLPSSSAIPDRENTTEHVDSSLNNLEVIKDALPDV